MADWMGGVVGQIERMIHPTDWDNSNRMNRLYGVNRMNRLFSSDCSHHYRSVKSWQCYEQVRYCYRMCNLLLFSATICVFLHLTAGKAIRDEHHCGYDSCPKPKKGFLNVHMVPHTHDDVGWLKTVDQYYYGSHSRIQLAGVQYILDSVIQELLNDPQKRFIYVETAFFWKWWMKQNDSRRHQVKMLVNSGRLEFIGGGWAMHDEAVTHYQSIIDQMTWGFRKLNDTFGSCGRPRVGWQIDPFGHSSESASIMARLGFDGLFFGRLDYQDKMRRLANKTAEMIWESSKNLGSDADLFTSVLYNHYSAPNGFCFDVSCSDEPIIDDVDSPEYNAERKANEFILKMKIQALLYKGENIIVSMGDDFNYQDAHMNFANMDRLIKAVNAQQSNGSPMNLFYSTPSCYLKAVNDEQIQFPTKSDDFFPYSSDPHSFWSGYYTSRPAIKYFERIGNNFLQVCKQLYVLGNLDPKDRVDLNVMREAMGIMQHHDAVTGTEKQAVAFDYARILSKGFTECGAIIDTAMRKLLINQTLNTNIEPQPVSDFQLNTCMLLNISACEITETNSNFVVTLYNPLSRPVTHYVRIPTKGELEYVIYDSKGTKIATQIVPIPDSVLNMPGRISEAKYEIVFIAKDLPPVGFRSYYVGSTSIKHNREIVPEMGSLYTIGHKKGGVINVDGLTGAINNIHLTDNTTLEQSFWYYTSYSGNNAEFRNRSSGAYIFRPYADPIMINPQPKIKGYKGPLVEEIHQKFNDWTSQVIRVYKGAGYMEFNWQIGPIPVQDNVGREVISRFNLNSVASNKTFFTDSNGREMIERTRDYRPTYNVKLEENVAGNYYPVTTRIMIKDNDTQFSVITDRSQGGTSLKSGELELMVHRRMLHDDAFGVNEALNEEAFGTGLVVRGTHYITIGDPKDQSLIDRSLIQEKVLSPWIFFTLTTKSYDEWRTENNMEYSALKSALPDCVQILTLEPWKGKSLLLRLEHIAEKEDSSQCNKPINFKIQEIFKPFTLSFIQETNLGSNQWISEVSRLVWKKESNDVHVNLPETPVNDIPNISLKPMEIRTFVIEIEFNSN